MHTRKRFTASRLAFLPTWRAAAAGALVLSALSAVSRPALGFCRARSCDRATERCDEDQHGCVVTGAPLVWRAREIRVSVDPAGSARLGITAEQTAQVLQRTFDNWLNVTCPSGGSPSLSLSVTPLLSGAMNDGDVIVTYVDAGWNYPASYGAITQLTVDPDTGEIAQALLQINSQSHALAIDARAPAIDLEAVLTHEVGHLIGLDHSRVPGATMVAETQAFGTSELRTLDADDVAGICALYPFRAPKAKRSGSDSSCALRPATSSAEGTSTVACVLAAAWVCAARRRRSRRSQF